MFVGIFGILVGIGALWYVTTTFGERFPWLPIVFAIVLLGSIFLVMSGITKKIRSKIFPQKVGDFASWTGLLFAVCALIGGILRHDVFLYIGTIGFSLSVIIHRLSKNVDSSNKVEGS